MAKAIIDEQNLTDIAYAIRAKNGSADTYTPSEMATAIGDLPTPTPVTKGLVFSDYDADGYPTKAEFVGSWTEIPDRWCNYLFYYSNNFSSVFTKKINSLVIPSGVTTIGKNAFYRCAGMSSITIPNSVEIIDEYAFQETGLTTLTLPPTSRIRTSAFQGTKIQTLFIPSGTIFTQNQQFKSNSLLETVTYEGQVSEIYNQMYYGNNATTLYDFSNHTGAIPSLYSTASLGHASGCVIKVPSALLSTWQTTAVWQDLTGVVWQGV